MIKFNMLKYQSNRVFRLVDKVEQLLRQKSWNVQKSPPNHLNTSFIACLFSYNAFSTQKLRRYGETKFFLALASTFLTLFRLIVDLIHLSSLPLEAVPLCAAVPLRLLLTRSFSFLEWSQFCLDVMGCSGLPAAAFGLYVGGGGGRRFRPTPCLQA